MSQPVFAARASAFATLPPGARVAALRADSAGNVYVAGSVAPAQPKSGADSTDAFVAKLGPDAKVLYWTVLAGANADSAAALAIDAGGNAYVAGSTSSPDFPATADALQTALGAVTQAFVAKVDPQGAARFVTFLGGTSRSGASDVSLTGAGEILVTGFAEGAFPTTPGAVATSAAGAPFIARLDAAGTKLLVALRGIGGSKIVSDRDGSMYTVGSLLTQDVPITPGAFQATHVSQACAGTSMLGIPCSYQHVAKLNADGTRLLFATFVTGSFGAAPAAMAVDEQGNVLLAGTTNSPDYPTTPGALLERSIAATPPPPITGPHPAFVPPPSSGYFTKLNGTGTALLYSTFFSGTEHDTITGMEVTADSIFLTGYAASPDLPGLTGTPAQCVPQFYVARMTLDGLAVSHTQLLDVPSVPASSGPDLRAVVAVTPAGDPLIAATNPTVFRVDPEASEGPVACIADSADLRLIGAVAPGELVSIFGRSLAPVAQPDSLPTSGTIPLSLQGLTVTFDGIPAPILYVSPQQVNAQVPFEVAGRPSVTMELTTAGTAIQKDTRTLVVAARQPAVFLRPERELSCNGTSLGNGNSPLALNEDGTPNTCASPAKPGSVVSLFLNGLGVVEGASATGAITAAPPPALSLPLMFSGSDQPEIVSAAALPGAISGVWRVQVKVPLNTISLVMLTPMVDSVPAADPILVIWVR